MRGQEGPAGGARAQSGAAEDEPARTTEKHGADWDGRVAPMGDDLLALDETTERSPADAGAGDRSAAVNALPPAVPARDDKLGRERRATVVSSISAELAKSMMNDVPGTPATMHHQPTRPISEAESRAVGARPEDEAVDHYSVELIDEPSLPPRAHIQSLIHRARTLMEAENLGAAVIAADQTLVEAAKAKDEVADLVKAAQPLFDRIFAAYVGLLGQIPVRIRSNEDLIGQELGERTQLLLSHIGGQLTLEEVAARSGIPPVEAMKIAASLLAAGIVKV